MCCQLVVCNVYMACSSGGVPKPCWIPQSCAYSRNWTWYGIDAQHSTVTSTIVRKVTLRILLLLICSLEVPWFWWFLIAKFNLRTCIFCYFNLHKYTCTCHVRRQFRASTLWSQKLQADLIWFPRLFLKFRTPAQLFLWGLRKCLSVNEVPSTSCFPVLFFNNYIINIL